MAIGAPLSVILSFYILPHETINTGQEVSCIVWGRIHRHMGETVGYCHNFEALLFGLDFERTDNTLCQPPSHMPRMQHLLLASSAFQLFIQYRNAYLRSLSKWGTLVSCDTALFSSLVQSKHVINIPSLHFSWFNKILFYYKNLLGKNLCPTAFKSCCFWYSGL